MKLREWSVKQGYHPTYYSEVKENSRYVFCGSDACVRGLPHDGGSFCENAKEFVSHEKGVF